MATETDNPTGDDLIGTLRFPTPRRPRSEAQIEASRRNGAKSRGTKTRQGRIRSRQNALKHGLVSRLLTPPGDPRAQDELYRKIRGDLIDELAPDTFSEVVEVDTLAHLYVQQARVIRMIESIQTPNLDPDDRDEFAAVDHSKRQLALLDRGIAFLEKRGSRLKRDDALWLGEMVVARVAGMEADFAADQAAAAEEEAERQRRAQRWEEVCRDRGDFELPDMLVEPEAALAPGDAPPAPATAASNDPMAPEGMAARGGGGSADGGDPFASDQMDAEEQEQWDAHRARMKAIAGCGDFFHAPKLVAKAVAGGRIGDDVRNLLLEILRGWQEGLAFLVTQREMGDRMLRVRQAISLQELTFAAQPGTLMLLHEYLMKIRREIRASIRRLRKR